MKPPIKPPSPAPGGDREPEKASASQAESESKPPRRPGGHGSYTLGGEPAVGQRWHEAPPPPPATMTRFDDTDDGVPHKPHPPGDDDPLHNEDIDHEHRDVNIKAVIGSAIILTVVGVVAQVAMWLLFGVFESRAAARDPQLSPLQAPAVQMPPNTRESPFFNPSVGGPQLLTNEPMGLANVRGAEQKRLQGYGWVNQAGGVAYIPIEEAKKLLKERGVPVREGEPLDPSLGTRAPSRGEASGGKMLVVGGQTASAPEPAPAPTHSETPASGAPTAKPQGTGKH